MNLLKWIVCQLAGHQVILKNGEFICFHCHRKFTIKEYADWLKEEKP